MNTWVFVERVPRMKILIEELTVAKDLTTTIRAGLSTQDLYWISSGLDKWRQPFDFEIFEIHIFLYSITHFVCSLDHKINTINFFFYFCYSNPVFLKKSKWAGKLWLYGLFHCQNFLLLFYVFDKIKEYNI